MRYAQKLICLLLLVLSASFGIGGCYLLYSDFGVQLERIDRANAAAHAQTCTLLQTEIIDLQRRGEDVGDQTVANLLLAKNGKVALWRGEKQLCNTLPVACDAPLQNGTMRTVRSGETVTALYGSDLQGNLHLVSAFDLTGLYQDRNASLRRFLGLEAVVLAAGAAVMALLARQVTRPLRVLTATSAEIAAGEYGRRTDLHTGDELEQVSRSFDKMADAVQEKIADLEADVQKREDFMGAFTHELKTPMTSIIGYADVLRSLQTDPEEQREAAAAIYHEGRRLESLSQKLLALLALGEEELQLTDVDLADLWPQLRAACPAVNLQTPQDHCVVEGDADLLLDLLCNLVQNGAKAGAPDAPVAVRCLPGADTVTLEVEDHGCGIPQTEIERVTEPFYMVDKSRARKQGGSGLGLALCKRIAAAHGSDLVIESEPGQGTTVRVTLRKGGTP